MSRRPNIASFGVLCALLANTLTSAARAAEPVVQPALDGIFAAFETHPLVGIGDQHELANEEVFYGAVMKDPRFAAIVGNVVVEFGASQHQDILDRYLAGEEIPYSELAKVWRNTVAWDPTVMAIGYQTFFAQVRAVNLSLRADRHIRVLLSEPPIDWSAIHTKEAWQQIYDQRNPHAASVIAREVLEPRKKALVIYGTGHFHSFPWPSTLPVPSAGTATLREIVERTHPGAFYLITPYAGYEKAGCAAALEAEMKWPKRVLIAPVRGTSLETTLMRPECKNETLRGVDRLPPADEVARILKRFDEIDTGVAGDALLYLAPEAELTRSASDPTAWIDAGYNKELQRRAELRHGKPYPFAELLPFVPGPSQPLRPR